MKIINFIRSLFINSKEKAKTQYLSELQLFREKIVEAMYTEDDYKSALEFSLAIENKSPLIVNISQCFKDTNYGQHEEFLVMLENTRQLIDRINDAFERDRYFSDDHKTLSIDNLALRLPGEMKPRRLIEMKREDELTWTGDLEFKRNSLSIKRYIEFNFKELNTVLQKTFDYITNKTTL